MHKCNYTYISKYNEEKKMFEIFLIINYILVNKSNEYFLICMFSLL